MKCQQINASHKITSIQVQELNTTSKGRFKVFGGVWVLYHPTPKPQLKLILSYEFNQSLYMWICRVNYNIFTWCDILSGHKNFELTNKEKAGYLSSRVPKY